jgi:hypothetical protein
MHKRIMNGDEPAVDQGEHYGWRISWNPDDGRYYVEAVGRETATFAEWRNAIQYARTHQ